MSIIKEAWEKQRLDYQHRYVEACVKYKESQNKNFPDVVQGRCHGAMLEMSWVLITIFGLSPEQVKEAEKNAGFTDADIEGI